MKPVRIVIAYGNPDLARSLRWLLEMRNTFQVVGEAHAGEEAVDLVKQLNPDVVVVSLGLSSIDGFEVTRTIRSATPKVGVILVTSLEPDHLQQKAADAGALSLLPLDRLHETIYEAVISAHEGRQFFPPNS